MKTKFKNITAVRKNLFDNEKWLMAHNKKKDQKCNNCDQLYIELDCKISLASSPGKLNKHLCNECADHYISLGAEDVNKKIEKMEYKKKNLINNIKNIGKWRKNFFDKRELEEYKIEELEKMFIAHKAQKEKEDRIAAITISEEDAYMEDYLVKEYDVIQDTKYLKCEEQIEDYFTNDYSDYFDCGQGYFEDEAEVIIKIAKKFYLVNIKAEIYSAKQDVGDRLYWVESIEEVTWKEINKPEPKNYEVYAYQINLNKDQKKQLENFMKKLGLLYIIDTDKV